MNTKHFQLFNFVHSSHLSRFSDDLDIVSYYFSQYVMMITIWKFTFFKKIWLKQQNRPIHVGNIQTIQIKNDHFWENLKIYFLLYFFEKEFFNFGSTIYWVSQKEFGVENCNIFTNGAMYQCNILRYGTYNLYLSMCKVSIQYVKGNLSYDHERNDGSKGTWIKHACV